MKICMIGKISPIQGGVSKMNFWMCQALAKAGHEIHLVTNSAEVESQYRTVGGKIAPDLSNSPLAGLQDRLTIHYTNERMLYSYIPYANPFVSKLASMAIEVVRRHGCDLIFGHYFEPYGVAAYLASLATGVPFGLKHAGSDVGRLLQNPELRTLYGEAMRKADYIFASGSTTRRFLKEGVDASRLYRLSPACYPDDLYTPDCEPLDIRRHVADAREELRRSGFDPLFEAFPPSNYDPKRMSVGIYGKVGEQKGSYDLIHALGLLKQRGVDFNFFGVTNGSKKNLEEFLHRIRAADLLDRTIWMPFVPHWKIPAFIKLCDCVCFLEREFSIPIHRPAVASEVMLCSTCLIVSDEIASKHAHRSALRDGENVLVIDPRNIEALADKVYFAISDPERSREIGRKARETMIEQGAGHGTVTEVISEAFEQVFDDIQTRRLEVSMIEYQAFMNRLYTDDVFRQLNRLSPETAQSRYRLSDEEKALLRKIEHKAIEDFASSLKLKAMQKHAGLYPLTLAVVGKPRASEIFDRYYALNRPYPGETKLSLVNKFGQFLEDSLLADGDQDALACELVRFERVFNQLSLQPRPEDDFSHINRKDSALPDELSPHMLVRLAGSTVIETFAYDVAAIAEQLRKHEEMGTPAPRPTRVAFVVSPNEARPKVLKINEASYHLLNFARRKSLLADFLEKFSPASEARAKQADVVEAVRFFARIGMLTVDAAPAAA
ncbi:hypothetical protein C5O80_11125 [Burkholderia sp. SRS-46]|nr:hypothetical protein C5O80_11125 [Burkholderia sp. SRS-46]